MFRLKGNKVELVDKRKKKKKLILDQIYSIPTSSPSIKTNH